MFRFVAMMYLIGCSLVVTAQPTVIYDSGRTVNTEKYRQFLTAGESPDFLKNGWVFNDEPEPDSPAYDENAEVGGLYPITTTKLSPGKIKQEKNIYVASLPGPICIVGADPLSKQWIQKNYQYLLDMKAMCLIVQAKNQIEADDLLQLLPGLIVSAGNGDELAEHFHIKHYPVVINERMIFQ